MPVPVVPLLVIGGAALAAFAFGGKKDPFKGMPTTMKAAGLFDANETPEQASAVQTALALETDPAKLDAFADRLTPDYPNSAKLLHAKAAALRAAHPAPPVPAPPIPLPPQVPVPPQAQPAPAPTPAAPPPLPLPAPLPLPTPIVVTPPAAPLPAPLPIPAIIPAAVLQENPATITTTDASPGPGDLKIRSTPSNADESNVVGTTTRGSPFFTTGPQVPDLGGKNPPGWFPVHAPQSSAGDIRGFAAAQFVLPQGSSAAVPGNLPILTPVIATTPDAPDAGQQTAHVTTNDPSPAGDLNMRSAPSTSASIVTTIPKDSDVPVTGPEVNGFLPVTFNGQSGFASAAFLSMNTPDSGITAGMYFAGAWPKMTRQQFQQGPRARSKPRGPTFTAGFDPGPPMYASQGGRGMLMTGAADPNELQNSATALAQSLSTHSCRAYDEPIVRRFQFAAHAAGRYAGKPHGSYDEATRKALASVVGPSAPPACFASTGGPKNFDDYWKKGL